jgi:hypothetical protein
VLFNQHRYILYHSICMADNLIAKTSLRCPLYSSCCRSNAWRDKSTCLHENEVRQRLEYPNPNQVQLVRRHRFRLEPQKTASAVAKHGELEAGRCHRSLPDYYKKAEAQCMVR